MGIDKDLRSASTHHYITTLLFLAVNRHDALCSSLQHHGARQGCQSGAMALKTAPVKISWRQGLLLQRQTTLQQAIMNCLTALSGHAANARCSTVAPQRRHMHHGHTYLQPNSRACAYGRIFLCMRSARNCFGAAFSAPAKKHFDTPG